MTLEFLVVAVAAVGIVGFMVIRSVRVVPQGTAAIVERLGGYHRTLDPGMNLVVPLIDRVKETIDMRERAQAFPPHAVTTADSLVVTVDVLLFYQVTNPKAATYEIANYLGAMEQLIATTLRKTIGGMEIDAALTAREEIAAELRDTLTQTTEAWGVRVRRVELKAIDPPAAVQESMERHKRAERDREAAIAVAEGEQRAAILSAEGEKRAALLRAEGEAEAIVLRAQAEARAEGMRAKGQADAIGLLARALAESEADQRLLAYQYLITLPEIAKGQGNSVWVVPPEQAAFGLLRREGDPR